MTRTRGARPPAPPRQCFPAHDIPVAGELLFLIDVVQAKLDLPTALRQRLDVADDQRLGLDNAPVLVHDLSVLGRARNEKLLVERRETAAARPAGLDHRGDVLRGLPVAGCGGAAT